MTQEQSSTYYHIEQIYLRSGPLANSDYEPNKKEVEDRLNKPVLVIGAGGLGCELLKDLALMGFKNIHVIDMDTIDLSNLNRQFLFRQKDIGESKAIVAANFINERIVGTTVTPHHAKIQDKDNAFYQQFSVVVCGLDSVKARRWINAKLVELVKTDKENNPIVSTVIPLIDGGTEGFKGHVKVIVPKLGPCFDCLLPLFPPQLTFAMCTLQSTPRLPEHCIAYVKLIQWNDEKPFKDERGNRLKIDTDNPEHMRWIYDNAVVRAKQFNIEGVTFKLTQGVVKNIIPAIASTNAIISALCANEAFKFITQVSDNLDNFQMNNGLDGHYSFSVSHEAEPNCLVCSTSIREINFPSTITVEDFIHFLQNDPSLQLQSPSFSLNNGAPVYLNNQASHKERLSKLLSEFVNGGDSLLITDPVFPSPVIISVNYK